MKAPPPDDRGSERKFAAVILAAGASTRMGRPKALLAAAGGATFLDTLAATLATHCEPVIAVLGHAAEEIRQRVRVRCVVNERWTDGQLSSLQRGLREAPPEAAGVVFTLVDHPHVRAETVATLIRASGPAGAAVPVFQGRRGHPVACSAELVRELLMLGPERQARDLIHRPGTIYVDVDDPAVVEDIDDPEAYRKLVG